MALDLASAVQQQQSAEQRRADLDRRDADHGGMRSIADLVEQQAKQEAARDWRAYRPSVKRSEVIAAQIGVTRDFARIDARRLLTDCRAAVRRFTRLHRFGGMRRSETAADILATDAALILLAMPTHGGGLDAKTGRRSSVLDLGGEGGLPMRRDWLDRVIDPAPGAPNWKLSNLAWSALLKAVKEAARAPEVRAAAAAETAEESTNPLDIAAMVETQQRESDAAVRLPDNAAPEVIASALDIPLDAARAIVARAYPAATMRDLGEAWKIGAGTLKVALSRGAETVRRIYPNPADLLDALDAARGVHQQRVATEVALTLLDYRAGRAPERAAADAALEWRSVYGTPSTQRRALDIATRERQQRAERIARRLRLDWQSVPAERISASVARLLPSEQRRAEQSASAARSSHLGGRALTMAEQRQSSAYVQRETRASRVWSYGLEARTDRENRPIKEQRWFSTQR